jgi:hypothetical protein
MVVWCIGSNRGYPKALESDQDSLDLLVIKLPNWHTICVKADSGAGSWSRWSSLNTRQSSARSRRIRTSQPEDEIPLQIRCRCTGHSYLGQPQVAGRSRRHTINHSFISISENFDYSNANLHLY